MKRAGGWVFNENCSFLLFLPSGGYSAKKRSGWRLYWNASGWITIVKTFRIFCLWRSSQKT